MMIEKELVLSLSDLRCVAVTCEGCRQRLTLDLESPPPREANGYPLPDRCRSCGQEYGDELVKGLQALQRAYVALLPVAEAETEALRFRCDASAI